MMYKSILMALLLGSATATAFAQTEAEQQPAPRKHSWEIGLGAGMANWSRVAFSDFRETETGYHMSLNARHLLGGPSLYVAYEILPWLYVDAQGSVDFAQVAGLKETSYKFWTKDFNRLYMGGLGLQLRLTPLMPYKFVEPYFRVGVNYLYKDFMSVRKGDFQGDTTNEANWQYTDTWNKSAKGGENRNSAIPVSLGLGVKGWLSDCIGLGLQGEYLMPVRREIPNFARVSASLIFRIGGETKRPEPRISYVEVEKIVERPVEKIVEKEVKGDCPEEIHDLLAGIHFLFDSDEMTSESNFALDKLATALKARPGQHFLIIGMTDAKGTQGYNKPLSERRAQAVYQALIDRGVSAGAMKHCGIGKGASILPAGATNEARLGDRKVVIEVVTIDAYWDSIK